ncbi:MAG: 3-dehydroquinate dehydratase, partial [Mesorhizobium sp.]
MSLIYVLNGPNLNLLGKRQPHIYGHETLADVAADCRKLAADLGHEILFHQSNREYEIIDWIHEAREDGAGIVINPAAFTHTSIAILDALNTFEGPVIEIHISNVHKRESFRHHSFVSHR